MPVQITLYILSKRIARSANFVGFFTLLLILLTVTLTQSGAVYDLKSPPSFSQIEINASRPRPVAVTVNSNTNTAYVVNIGDGTVATLNGAELTNVLDLKQVDRSATSCNGPTPYGRCLNAITIHPQTERVYVTEWYYDVVQIIEGDQVVNWAYAGKGPGGTVPEIYLDRIYSIDRWTAGITVIEDDQDQTFISLNCKPEAATFAPINNYLYVADGSCNTVAIIQGYEKLLDISVGIYPNALAYNPINHYIYVVNSGSNPATVSVIDRTNVIQTIPIGDGSTSLGIDSYWGIERSGSNHIVTVSATGYVYIANWASNTVTILDGITKLQDVPVGLNPNAIAYDPASGYIYVANLGGDSVSVICGTNVVNTIPVGDTPFDIAVNSQNGFVYVANRDSDSISILQRGQLLTTVPLTPLDGLEITDLADSTLAQPASASSLLLWLPFVAHGRCPF